MAEKIFLIHGRNYKPPENVLFDNYIEALVEGLDKYPEAKREAKDKFKSLFEDGRVELIYYGDLSNELLGTEEYDVGKDIADRRETLTKLKSHSYEELVSKEFYKERPGQSSLAEHVADAIGGIASFLKFSEFVISKFAKDMPHYWDQDSNYGSSVRWRLTEPLKKSLMQGDDVLLISHSLGTMIAYDTMWKLSYLSEHADLRAEDPKKITLVTLGSPLADETVKDNIKGAGIGGPRRFPNSIHRWVNVAAEDDPIAHDQTVANDFKKMKTFHNVHISDVRNYNMAVRDEKSNPHSGAGYLISPANAKALNNWLLTDLTQIKTFS